MSTKIFHPNEKAPVHSSEAKSLFELIYFFVYQI